MFAERARALRRADRLLQPGRRPGRARLRRPQLRRRRRAARWSPGRSSSSSDLLLWELGGEPGAGRASRSPTSTRSTRRSCSASATTRARTASSAPWSGSRAGSTRRWWRCSPPTRSAPSGSPAWSCPPPTPARRPRPTRGRSPRNLGAELIELPIARGDGRLRRDPRRAAGRGEGLAAENVQARIRGNLLMALSNDRGSLVLTTGNKSEMSVGYATLYGDMAGGLAVIKDVPKQLVYELVEHRNARAGRELVPASVLERAALGRAARRPARRGLAAALRAARPGARGLRRARPLARRAGRRGPAGGGRRRGDPAGRPAEYKRRQAPPGIRITSKAFGRDRRLPITNRFGG